LSVQAGSLWGLCLGYGVLGGFGIGLGYLTPIAVAIKWAPRVRGFIGGVVVLGFGAGALIVFNVAPRFVKDPNVGPGWVLVTMGAVFTVLCTAMGLMMRNPPHYQPKPAGTHGLVPWDAISRWDFWALWTMFFLNICAGISLISAIVPMAKEIQGAKPAVAAVVAAAASLCNGLGRMFWSTVSDWIGRPAVFFIMFVSQVIVFAALSRLPGIWPFGAACCYILLCYGGGFGTMPAFTADIFGHESVGRVYGPMLTAWSAGGVVGPIIYAALREQTQSYVQPLYITAAALAISAILPLILGRPARRAVAEVTA